VMFILLSDVVHEQCNVYIQSQSRDVENHVILTRIHLNLSFPHSRLAPVLSPALSVICFLIFPFISFLCSLLLFRRVSQNKHISNIISQLYHITQRSYDSD